jgi:hypothetical protein
LSNPLPIRPDPMPLREALRGLRHVLRRGGETLLDTVPVSALPKPAQALAGAVLREMEVIAKGADGVASGLAKRVLGGAATAPSLDDLSARPDADAIFAGAAYAALRAVLTHLGAPGVLVSETAARLAYAEAGKGADAAGDLTLRLLDAKVIRGATAIEAARVPGAALEPVALFAMMLWLQADRPDAEGEAALSAATDLAVALAADVGRACAEADAARLSALYAEFAPHV